MIKNVNKSSCRVPVILSMFEWNLKFFDRFSKQKAQLSNFTNIRRVGEVLLRTDGDKDGQTDKHDKSTSRLS